MEEMTDRLNAILQDPEAMAKIQSLASSMFGGQSAPAPSAPQSVPVVRQPAPAVSAAAPAPMDGFSPELLSMMTRLTPMLQNMRRETPDTRLLQALRPMLSPPRQKRLDDAMKLMQLMTVLPLLRNTGLLKGLL
jgi:hypothetical protein